MPRTPVSSRDMAPARAVTSPSLATSSGTANSSPSLLKSVLHFAVAFLRDSSEQGRHAGLVVHVDSGSAAADGVDAGHLGGGCGEGCSDLGVVVGGIGLPHRGPDHLFGEDGLAVHDGGDLTVRGAEVEADAASVEMAPERSTGLSCGGHILGCGAYHCEWMAVDILAHEVVIELPFTTGCVGCLKVAGDGGWSPQVGLPSAALPEQELEKALCLTKAGRLTGMALGEDSGLEARDRSACPLETHDEPRSSARFGHFLLELPVGQNCGPEIGIERRNDGGRDEPGCVMHGENSVGRTVLRQVAP